MVGEFEQLEVKKSQAPGGGTSLSEGLTRRASVLPSVFTDLAIRNRDNGLTGYFVSPVTGAYRHTIPATELDARLMPPDPAVPDHQPGPAGHQYLRPWDAGGRARLGLPALPPDLPASNTGPTLKVVGKTRPPASGGKL